MIPLTCTYSTTFDLNFGMTIDNESIMPEARSDYDDPLTADDFDNLVPVSLFTADSFGIATPETDPMIGQEYHFEIALNDDLLPGMGFTVQSCRIETSGVIGKGHDESRRITRTTDLIRNVGEPT